jgi:hypothetical protein
MEGYVRRERWAYQRAANRGDIDLMSGCYYDGLLARPLLMSG